MTIQSTFIFNSSPSRTCTISAFKLKQHIQIGDYVQHSTRVHREYGIYSFFKYLTHKHINVDNNMQEFISIRIILKNSTMGDS